MGTISREGMRYPHIKTEDDLISQASVTSKSGRVQPASTQGRVRFALPFTAHRGLCWGML